MESTKIIEKIRNTRRGKGFTLDDLSGLTGLSKGYLSKLENATSLPPISTLHRIAEGLGIPFASLFTDSADNFDRKISIVRKKERKEMVVEFRGTRFKHWPLADEKVGRNVNPYIIEIPSVDSQVYQHEGEEFYLMLEGSVEFSYGGERHILNEGDSVYFDTDVPHSAKTISKKPAKALVIFYDYKRIMRNPFVEPILQPRDSKTPIVTNS